MRSNHGLNRLPGLFLSHSTPAGTIQSCRSRALGLEKEGLGEASVSRPRPCTHRFSDFHTTTRFRKALDRRGKKGATSSKQG